MFKFIKEIFSSKKEPEVHQVKVSELEQWFKEEVAKIEFNSHAQEYFQKIRELKTKLKDKTELLEKQEISEKDKKQVEHRVQNIVIGHKQHYLREITRFLENLSTIDNEKFSSIDDYQQVLEYNKNIDQEIGALAKRTAKSYQAAQHLFFDGVENIFKLMGELNLHIKNFDKETKKFNVEQLEEVQQLIINLNQEIEKEANLKIQIQEEEKKLSELKNQHKEKENKLTALNKSNEYKNYLGLKDQEEEFDKKIKEIDDKIFSYFSKLGKALRKYVRVALDDKLIKRYLEDSLVAFWSDSELEIANVLGGLKKNLIDDKLQFNEKQTNNFIGLIKKGEEGYLSELSSKGKSLQSEKALLLKTIKENKIVAEIKRTERDIDNSSNKIKQKGLDISELRSKLEKINLEKIKEKIKDAIEENLKDKIITIND